MKKREVFEKAIYILFTVTFLVLMYLRNVMDIYIPTIIVTIIIAVYMIATERKIAEILAFLIPFRAAIQANYVILIAILIYLVKNKGKIKIYPNFILLFIMLIIELANCFNAYSDIKEYLTFSLSWILMYFVIHSNYNSETKVSIIKNNLLGILMATYFYLFKTFRNVSIANFILYKYRLGVTNMKMFFEQYNLSFNVNEIALYALVALALLIFLKNKNKINKYIFYIASICIVFIGFLTMSRAFLIGLFFFLCLSLYSNRKNVKKTIAYFLIVLTIIFGIYTFNSDFFDKVVSNYQSRFEASDITNGRTKIFNYYNERIVSSSRNLLIGVGTQNYHLKNNFSMSAHNSSQEIIICWGIVGGMAFVLLLFSYYKKSKLPQVKYNLNFYLPLISLLFMVQSIPFISQGMIIMMIYVVLAPFGIEN